MNRSRTLILTGVLLVATLAACIPAVPFLRNIDGQTWSARFQVEVQVAGAAIRLPVDLALTFSQRLQDVTAKATLQYDTGIFRLQTGSIVDLTGRIGLDDHLELRSGSNVLAFDGSFAGERLVGTVSIAGVVPVANVAFTRTR